VSAAKSAADVFSTKPFLASGVSLPQQREDYFSMRGILLWVVGIPIPVIILLYLFHVI
jgi:hypothetical protein